MNVEAGSKARERVSRWLPGLCAALPLLFFSSIAFHLAAVPPPGPSIERSPGAARALGGLSLAKRRFVFARLASGDAWRWRLARSRFPDAWSQHDDYANQLRAQVHAVADELGLHYSQVFLVYDEGLRERWPGVGGRPLAARWPPLRPRTR